MGKSFKGFLFAFLKVHIMTTFIGLFSFLILAVNILFVKFFVLALCNFTYCICIYTFCWKLGFDENGRVESGFEKYDKYKALKAGGCMLIVPILLALVCAIVNKEGIHNLFAFAFNMNSFAALTIFSFRNMGIYMIVINLVYIVFAHLGYTLGYKDIKIIKKLMYK